VQVWPLYLANKDNRKFLHEKALEYDEYDPLVTNAEGSGQCWFTNSKLWVSYGIYSFTSFGQNFLMMSFVVQKVVEG
jgi:hypothetical protein